MPGRFLVGEQYPSNKKERNSYCNIDDTGNSAPSLVSLCLGSHIEKRLWMSSSLDFNFLCVVATDGVS